MMQVSDVNWSFFKEFFKANFSFWIFHLTEEFEV